MSEGLIDALCGGISGILTNFFTHPLDTVKCRMQTNFSSTKNKSGMLATLTCVIKQERFIGLYKGFFANTLINVPISSMQFSIFGLSLRLLNDFFPNNKNLMFFISGCIAGVATVPFTVPLEMIKCNQQVNFHGKTKKENRFIKKTQHIYRKGGFKFKIFFKGSCAVLNRDCITTGAYFYIYYSIKDYCRSNKIKFNSLEKGFAGGFAGLITWFITYPFDTIKCIIQTGPFKEISPKQIDIFKKLYNQGGIVELYRGALPAMSLSVFSAALGFIFFELAKSFLSLK